MSPVTPRESEGILVALRIGDPLGLEGSVEDMMAFAAGDDIEIAALDGECLGARRGNLTPDQRHGANQNEFVVRDCAANWAKQSGHHGHGWRVGCGNCSARALMVLAAIVPGYLL